MTFSFRIVVKNDVTYVETSNGDKIPVMTLFALKGACKLEALGMKHSSGRSACQKVRNFLMLPRNTPRQKVADSIADVVDTVKMALEHENQKRLSYS